MSRAKRILNEDSQDLDTFIKNDSGDKTDLEVVLNLPLRLKVLKSLNTYKIEFEDDEFTNVFSNEIKRILEENYNVKTQLGSSSRLLTIIKDYDVVR